jgi:uncharacterized C2H2 Zn-finger protein
MEPVNIAGPPATAGWPGCSDQHRQKGDIGTMPQLNDPAIPTKHEIKQCPRCGAAFECKVNNPLHCQCAHILLSSDQLETLQARYDDCLCANCLQQVADAGPGPVSTAS